MLPGVSSGDSAELQYCSKLLGICHPPGYQIEVSFGKLFCYLPIGAGVAWRINFMMVVFGILGTLSLYGVIRRITGFIMPGVIASATLGFSSIYWTHCLHAEAYVFYSSFLLMGLYTFVRFVQDDKAYWLYLTALLVGICVADRASELSVLPGFLIAMIFAWKKFKLGIIRPLLAIVIFVLPFVYTVSFYFMRTSQEYLHLRDTKIRHKVLSKEGFTEFKPRKNIRYWQVKAAAKQRLGLNYSKQAKFASDRVSYDVDKYKWLLSGAGAFGDRYPKNDRRYAAQGSGTSIGLLAFGLGVLAIAVWRRDYGWVLLGVCFFAGNLLFILWHSRWDNLTFTIPGLTGLALIAGLGAAGPSKWGNQKRRYIFQACCLIVPLFLLVTNYRYMDMSTPETRKTLEYNNTLAAYNWPDNSVFVDGYWPGMTLRYLFYVEADRPDIHVMYEDDRPDWNKLIEHFNGRGHPVFLKSNYINPKIRVGLSKLTDKEIVKLGFICVNPSNLPKK